MRINDKGVESRQGRVSSTTARPHADRAHRALLGVRLFLHARARAMPHSAVPSLPISPAVHLGPDPVGTWVCVAGCGRRAHAPKRAPVVGSTCRCGRGRCAGTDSLSTIGILLATSREQTTSHRTRAQRSEGCAAQSTRRQADLLL